MVASAKAVAAFKKRPRRQSRTELGDMVLDIAFVLRAALADEVGGAAHTFCVYTFCSYVCTSNHDRLFTGAPAGLPAATRCVARGDAPSV